MRELSLFTGAGGGLLGSLMLDWHPVGYVENNDYCQQVIAARIKDGVIPDGPIFGNIETFNREGFAASYQGLVDVITAGFPCPYFSIASAAHGTRQANLWPETLETIRIIRPGRVLLENSEQIIKGGYVAQIAADLGAIGYMGRYDVIPAYDLGADHFRPRAWIAAHANSDGLQGFSELCSVYAAPGKIPARRETAGSRDKAYRLSRYAQPYFSGKTDGLANRVERSKAIGNGQFPRVAHLAGSHLLPKETY